jgi:hypothetical protein
VSARWILRFLLLLPAGALTVAAIPRFHTGLLLERAFPATAYIQTDTPLPMPSYRQAANLLAGASRNDPETALLQAEAAIDAGAPSQLIVTKVERALSSSPLSARGWIILASLLTQEAPQKAAKALTLGFDLAPRDYYLILPRTLVAAPLWSHLQARVQTILLNDVKALAADPEKRDQLRLLLSKPGGAELVVRSFAGRPDSLRELNRTLAREVLHL